jgi:hypothetical protein
MKHIKFLPDAEEEMYEAAKYYQSQTSGLGVDFLSEVERAIASIAQYHDMAKIKSRSLIDHQAPFVFSSSVFFECEYGIRY